MQSTPQTQPTPSGPEPARDAGPDDRSEKGTGVGAKVRAGRAYTADLVRVALFTGVVIAHSVNAINYGPPVTRASHLAGTLLHLTRYGFVVVTLFVLVLSMRGKTMTATEFWRRRFGLVLWPYLLWTIIYSITDHLLIPGNPFPHTRTWFSDLGMDLIGGTGKYQLYFLLISMQIYLLFPLITKIVERYADHPWRVIAVGAVIQVGMFSAYQYTPRPLPVFWSNILQHLWKTAPMYALFIVIGAVAAYHHEAVERWLRTHAGIVVACALGSAALSVTAYWRATTPDEVPWLANSPWNPVNLPWLVCGFGLLWLGATVWDDRRRAGRRSATRLVSWATMRAFGVFAVHPLILDILGRTGFLRGLFEWFPGSPVTRAIVLIVTVLTLSLLLVDVLLRTPVSRHLVARPRIPLPGERRLREARARRRTRVTPDH
ncbi:acyltransferase [Gordonia sp. (in: high G+C Gram-positive bacteria)]|uniref:acyltransferase n=1 Tax=Gordonia sp. (in: high G+C Gram-positive bacteria) TaxID=84139 RepID=UPI001DB6F9AB|nr:acyltransferase [Gordonia sp. (in: high G+C Gram-positive bacteria)]MCB1293852.1 acyltransferase [Gordonia sp. (in: high G+C Gram-positive bacteria)]HMS74617.1 acyltransferase [Gordonia sp. (in: high G+C Gram-positive bacteria)]